MNIQEELIQLKTKKAIILQQITKDRDIVNLETSKYSNQIKARFVLVEVSKQTQEHLKVNIEKLVNLCLNEVFPDRNFNFKADFQIKRNKMECEFLVEVDGHEYSPKDDMGGSILDIISFALRIILWSFENPRSRNVIIMDEPFRFSGRLITKAVQMVKELSKKLGIQFIINTHSDELIDIADRSWNVVNVKGKSMVTQS
jgi:hypothetical protein